jgi:hypothetical protein
MQCIRRVAASRQHPSFIARRVRRSSRNARGRETTAASSAIAVYDDPVVKHGFARGTEPVAYVDQILARWVNYKEFVRETPTTQEAVP